MLTAESGDPVEQTDKSVVSRPADMVVQAESAAANGDIKAFDATIVVATYDAKRWPFLSAAVENLLSGPDRPRRVVVCVDQNEELYDRVRLAWPEVTALLNSGDPGASGTRNAGSKYADTPFIVFLDDDVRLLEGWLTRLLAPLADPGVVGTGGGVVAGWQTGRPKWFPEEFGWVVGASFRGMPTVQSAVRNVWAENMAVRTDVFRSVGGFRTDFGKVGSRNSPEDTDLCIRMAASVPQGTWVYAPDAVVEHHVPASRASFSFFLRRSYNEGRGKVEMADLLGRQEKLQEERDYVLRTLPAGILTGLRAVTRHGDLGGLLRAGAIVAGAVAAGIGATVRMRKHAGK
jgi:GT2 family glycosyltransferase